MLPAPSDNTRSPLSAHAALGLNSITEGTTLSTSIVVCAYSLERWGDICRALRSAAEQSPRPDELILIVDHNPDLLQRARTELHLPGLNFRVMRNAHKPGLSGARNTALAHASGEVVVFLDDDARAEPNWLAALLSPYQDSSVMAVGGVAAPRWPDGDERPSTLPAPRSGLHGELDWVVGCTYTGQPLSLAPVRNLMGCNMSFRRAIFRRVGGFREDLGRVGKTPLGGEETELCIRASQAYPHTKIMFEPQARVTHQISAARLTWRYLLSRCYAEGLSKASISTMVGADQALNSERTYTTRILPRAFARELARAFTGYPAGAAAIVLGPVATALGYLRGRIAGRRSMTAAPPAIRRPTSEQAAFNPESPTLRDEMIPVTSRSGRTATSDHHRG